MSNGRERQADAARRVAEALAVPLLTFLGARPENPTDPTAGLSLVVTERALNAAGMLHCGVIATMLDLAAYLTVLPTLDPSQQAVTHAFSASYLSPSAAGETVVARVAAATEPPPRVRVRHPDLRRPARRRRVGHQVDHRKGTRRCC